MNHSKNESLCVWINTLHSKVFTNRIEDKYARNEEPGKTFEDVQPALLTMDLLKSQRNWHRCNDHIARMRPEVVLQALTERKRKANSRKNKQQSICCICNVSIQLRNISRLVPQKSNLQKL